MTTLEQKQKEARETILDLWPNDDEITQTVMCEVDKMIDDIYNVTRQENIEKITEHFNEFASAADTDTDYCRGVKQGLRYALSALSPEVKDDSK
jgi:hypothetical protein